MSMYGGSTFPMYFPSHLSSTPSRNQPSHFYSSSVGLGGVGSSSIGLGDVGSSSVGGAVAGSNSCV